MLSIYIGLKAIKFYSFPPPLPPPPHFYCFSPPPPPHFYCFLSAPPPPQPPQVSFKDSRSTAIHALVQVLYKILMGHIFTPVENKRILLSYKGDLLDLARPNFPYKTMKRVLVQEGSGFIENLLALFQA